MGKVGLEGFVGRLGYTTEIVRAVPLCEGRVAEGKEVRIVYRVPPSSCVESPLLLREAVAAGLPVGQLFILDLLEINDY